MQAIFLQICKYFFIDISLPNVFIYFSITYKDFIKRYGGRQRVSDVVAASINVTKSVLLSTEENTDPLCRYIIFQLLFPCV